MSKCSHCCSLHAEFDPMTSRYLTNIPASDIPRQTQAKQLDSTMSNICGSQGTIAVHNPVPRRDRAKTSSRGNLSHNRPADMDPMMDPTPAKVKIMDPVWISDLVCRSRSRYVVPYKPITIPYKNINNEGVFDAVLNKTVFLLYYNYHNTVTLITPHLTVPNLFNSSFLHGTP